MLLRPLLARCAREGKLPVSRLTRAFLEADPAIGATQGAAQARPMASFAKTSMRPSKARRGARPAAPPAEEHILTLPEDLAALSRINPDLGEAVSGARMYEAEARERGRRAREGTWARLVEEGVLASAPAESGAEVPPLRLLLRLDPEPLRALARSLGDDPNGTDREVARGIHEGLLEGVVEGIGSGVSQAPSSQSDARRLFRGTSEIIPPPTQTKGRRRLPSRPGGAVSSVGPGAQPSAGAPDHGASGVDLGRALAAARAYDVLVLDVRGRCSYADEIVIATARTQRGARTAAGAVVQELKTRAVTKAAGGQATGSEASAASRAEATEADGAEALEASTAGDSGAAEGAGNPGGSPASPADASDEPSAIAPPRTHLPSPPSDDERRALASYAPSIEGGDDDSGWLVIDAGKVVVHVFLPEPRAVYNLEGLWGDRDGRNATEIATERQPMTIGTIR